MPRPCLKLLLAAGVFALSCGPVAAQWIDQEPELDYLQHCAGCHRMDGSGSAQNDVPDMRGVIGHFLREARGREFLVQVAGVAQAPITAANLAALLNWMLPAFSAAEIPDDFEPYTAAEVARLREQRPADLDALRQDVIATLAGRGYVIDDYRSNPLEQ